MNIGEGIDPGRASALLGWWRDAGVDVAVRADAPSWRSLAPAAKAPPASTAETPREAATKTAPISPPPPAAPKIELPTTLEGIETWLGERSATLEAHHHAVTIPEEAPLLVVGARAEGEAAMSEPAQALFERMMAAIGAEAPVLAMIDPATQPGQSDRAPLEPLLVEAIRRRIALARPQRLLLFGDQAARALLDTPLVRARGRLHQVEGTPCVATFHPRWLLDRTGDKRLAWTDLQILMGDE
ncbi:uracil-DNA glycosylase family protein [Sphingomicrobium arenosum]|uniref:uracil-DNA glycosylase family protein n=1 Tax=Sphingomicrobium arenosum TaxID=2233861 RepID=UPI00223FD48F|nr:uracil-DNA glycosylase family protein [Sphingomicrobium arenosum]